MRVNVYDVSGGSTNLDFSVQVQNKDLVLSVTKQPANQAPSITSPNTFTIAENSTAIGTITATDPENATLTYSISGGADSSLFQINPSTGALSFITAPDFEAPGDNGANNVYDVQVRVTDGINPVTQNLQVTVTNVVVENNNFANAFSLTGVSDTDTGSNVGATGETGEPTQSGTINSAWWKWVAPSNGTVTVNTNGSDFDTYLSAFTGSSVNNLTVIEKDDDDGVGNQSLVSFPVVAGSTYSFAVDGYQANTGNIVINLSHNQAPTITSGNTFNLAENSTAIGMITATDPENAALTYSISGGVDSSFFQINPGTGALSFITAPDFETPGDNGANNVYDVQVRVTDGINPVTQNLQVTVTNVVVENDNFANAFLLTGVSDTDTGLNVGATGETGEPTQSGTINSAWWKWVAPSNGTVTVNTNGSSFDTYLSAFTGSSVNNLTVIAQDDDGGDSTRSLVTFQAVAGTTYSFAVDGYNSNTGNIVINLSHNQAPTITSGNTFNLAENSTTIGTVTVTDPENAALTYSISGGADSSLFQINPSTGALSFITAPDFETPGDNGGDNVYDVQVRVTDGTNPVTQNIQVTVTDANEAPTITSGDTFTIAENETAIGTVTATDPENATLTYSISGGVDSSLFQINPSTGALSFITAPDFETSTDDGDLIEGGGTDVTNEDTSTPIEGGGAAGGIGTGGTATGGTGAATGGAATGGTATGGIATGGIATGVIATGDSSSGIAADNVYDVQVQVTDGTNPVTQDIQVTVTDTNEAPLITLSNEVNSLAENTDTTSLVKVADIVITDDALGSNNLSLSGADVDWFEIVGTELFIKAGTVLDYETQTSYSVTVEVDDPTIGNTPDNIADFNLTIIDQAVFSIDDVIVNEANGTATFTITATDPIASGTATINYATANDTAFAEPYDYVATSGTLTFNPGENSKTIAVTVNDDPYNELNENFTVNLSNPSSNATIDRGQATGTILDNDALPTLSINSMSSAEGNEGESNILTFVVSLSSPSAQTITVDYETADHSATVTDNDYVSQIGTLTFSPGNTVNTIKVAINGDATPEGDESFFVNLSNPSNSATLHISQGIGTIINDESGIVFVGTADDDSFTGGSGNDQISGAVGNDRLQGSDGNDQLTGDAGADILTGGLGADQFRYGNFSDSLYGTATQDRISDFNPGQGDRLFLPSLPTQVFSAGTITASSLGNAITSVFADADRSISGNQALAANEAVFFKWGSRRIQSTYLVVNDATQAFDAARDLFINVTGMVGSLSTGSLTTGNYFNAL